MGCWLGLAPAPLEFWVRFPNERNQGKQSHPVLKVCVCHADTAMALDRTGGHASSCIHRLLVRLRGSLSADRACRLLPGAPLRFLQVQEPMHTAVETAMRTAVEKAAHASRHIALEKETGE
jgi:hypothetical protein